MARILAVVAGLLMTLAGAWWTFQGLGWLGGDQSRFLGTAGPLVAGLGVALVIVAVRGPGHR